MASKRLSISKIAALAGVAMFAVTGGARAQGQVNIICSVPITWCEALIAQFQKDTGVKVGMTQKGSGEAMAQVAAEKANPKYDLWYAGTGDPQQAAALKDIPVLMIYGDFIAQDARWPQIRRNGIEFTEGIARAGGKVEVIDLPNLGIRGNSHMLMMDRNNLEVAALIQRWLERQGLYQESNADRRKQTGRRVLPDPYLYP